METFRFKIWAPSRFLQNSNNYKTTLYVSAQNECGVIYSTCINIVEKSPVSCSIVCFSSCSSIENRIYSFSELCYRLRKTGKHMQLSLAYILSQTVQYNYTISVVGNAHSKRYLYEICPESTVVGARS